MEFKAWVIVFLMAASLVGSYFVIRHNPRRYLALYLVSSVIGVVLCFGFVQMGFYVFPYKLLPGPIPLLEMLSVLPFIVLSSVYRSPSHWGYKIAFYWVVVHIVMLLEVLALFRPLNFIDYLNKSSWDVWDSYTWWWIYLLLFEYVGGLIIPLTHRRPIGRTHFHYGKLFWMASHFILITTIFLAGFYAGQHLRMK